MAEGLLIVHSDVTDGGDEDAFNRWYNEVHAPEIIERGAAVSFIRYKATDIPLSPGIPKPGGYVCFYRIKAKTEADVEAIEQRLRETKHLSRGVSPEMDRSTVKAGFYLPVEGDVST
jgi:hypothetical protein